MINTMPPNHTAPVIEVNGFSIREIRVRSGINTAPFAEQVGVDRSYLSRLETGARIRVSPAVFAAILDALGIKDRRAILAHPHGANVVELAS